MTTPITFTSKSGKSVTIIVGADQYTVSVDGKLLGETGNSLILAKYIKRLERELAATGCSHVLQVGDIWMGIPTAIAPKILAAREVAQPLSVSRQAQYDNLEAAYRAAKDAEEEAQEAAYDNDSGAGWDRVRELAKATEAARLAVVDFGDLHEPAMDEVDDDD
jgi:multidrug efflux pump subunit AcrA (membrane-fusion protein)